MKIFKITYRKKAYGFLIFSELLFHRWVNPLLMLLYLEFWQMAYSMAKYGRLPETLAETKLLFGVAGVLFIEMILSWARRYKSSRKQPKEVLLDKDSIQLLDESGELLAIFGWHEVKKIRKRNTEYQFSFHNGRRLTLAAEDFSQEEWEEFPSWIKKQHEIKTEGWKPLVLALSTAVWLGITCVGGFALYRTAVDLNGRLAWKLEAVRSEKEQRKVTYKGQNIYDGGIENALNLADKELELFPLLSVSQFECSFSEDGTIESLYMVLWGFDKDKNLIEGYDFKYDRTESQKLWMKIQRYNGSRDRTKDVKYDEAVPVETLIEKLSKESVREAKEFMGLTEKKSLKVSYTMADQLAENNFHIQVTVKEQPESYPTAQIILMERQP